LAVELLLANVKHL